MIDRWNPLNVKMDKSQISLLTYNKSLVHEDLFNIYILYLPRVVKICKETGNVYDTEDLVILPQEVKTFAADRCKKVLKQLDRSESPLQKLKTKLIELQLYDLAAEARDAQLKYET